MKTIRMCPTVKFYEIDENGDEITDKNGNSQYYHIRYERWHDCALQKKIQKFEEGITMLDMEVCSS